MGNKLIANPKLLWNDFFFVSTLNRKGGVLCNTRVSEGLKTRKSLAIHYWQDITISGVELNNNVININKLWRVSTSSVILYYFSFYFFQFRKKIYCLLISGIFDWNLKMLLVYLKSVPSKFSTSKIRCKSKMPKCGTKNVLFGYFWARILISIL